MEWQRIGKHIDRSVAPWDGEETLLCRSDGETASTMIVACFDDEVTPQHPWGTLDGPNYHKDWPTHWARPDPPETA